MEWNDARSVFLEEWKLFIFGIKMQNDLFTALRILSSFARVDTIESGYFAQQNVY